MPASIVNPWKTELPLSELTLYADWDSVAAMIESLRIHLFEYGTIPRWNFMFCGGIPELATPFSWAYTWPSLFAYLLEPNAAILAVWAVMSLVGLLATRALLQRWTGHPGAAWLGACLYAFSGCFAARFNAGHVTWAFFHLVPVMMLVFEVGLASRLRGRRSVGAVLLAAVTAFLFFTAGLPHGLMHFYPALLLLVIFRAAAAMGASGAPAALRALAPLAIAHLVGAGAAAYKVWPVIRWQMTLPRHNVRFEAYSLIEVVHDTLHFVSSYAQTWRELGRPYPAWGYNAFVGPMAWLLALVAAVALARRIANARSQETRISGGSADATAGWFALVLVPIGLALALGNDHPMGPARLFRHVPLLDGIRAFNRYQILVVTGLAILASYGFAWLAERLQPRTRGRWVLVAIAIVTAGPVLAQAVGLAWNLGALPHDRVLAWYRIGAGTDPPKLIGIVPKAKLGLVGIGHEFALLKRGYWLANCKADLTLSASVEAEMGEIVPLTDPPPVELLELTRDTLTLAVDVPTDETIHPRVVMLDGFERASRPPNPAEAAGNGKRGAAAVQRRVLTLRARYPGPRAGARASAAALLTGLLLLAAWLGGRRADTGKA